MKTIDNRRRAALVPPARETRTMVPQRRFTPNRAWRRVVRSPYLLVPLALLALLLRVNGLKWDDGYHLHPDERFITIVITDRILPDWPPHWGDILDPDHSPLNPRSNDATTNQPRDFAYGSLPLLVTKAVAAGAHVVTGAPWTDYDHVYLVGRALSALLDVGTMLLVFLLARRYGKGSASLAALLLALCVLPIQLAHFFATDTWVTFFATAAVLAFVAAAERGRTRDFILGGALTGTAVASKASVAFLVFPALAAIVIAWARCARERDVSASDEASPMLRTAYLALITFWAALITFAIAEPYALLRVRTYLDAVGTQARLVRGDLDYPYTRQYVGTGLMYHLKNLVLWGMGPALGAVVIVGLIWACVRTVRRRVPVDIVLIAWVAPYLIYTAPQSVKFMRYLQPVYPALIVLGVALLRDLTVVRRLRFPRRYRRFVPTIRFVGQAVGFIVIVGSCLWALAFSRIYDRPHSRVAASAWMGANIPPGATVATEVWDDALPLPVPYVPQYGCVRLDAADPSRCTGMDLYPDETNGEVRLRYLASALAQSDYIVLSSNRLYGSIPRLPWRYPVTIRYYDLLFAGKLGFETVYDATVSPSLGPWRIDDQHADESFTVYDHPRVTIFRKTQPLTVDQLRPLFADALAVRAMPTRDPPPKQPLLASPVETLPAVVDHAWLGSGGHRGVVVVGLYLLVFELFGVIGWSVAARAFRRFPDRGWGLSKLIGWLGAAYVVWIGASLKLWSFTNLVSLITMLALTLIAAGLYVRQRHVYAAGIRAAWRYMVAAEATTGVGFALFLWFRLQNPDLWQTYWGGEKPFEMAHINAILRSAHFPPYDPWFSGGYINYYYFGSYLHAFVMKLTGVSPEVAFNVAAPMTMALAWGGAFSVGAALWSLARRRRTAARAEVIFGGVAAAAAVGLLGNLDAFGQVMRALRAGYGVRGAVDRFDFWESRSIIPGTINEFPFFSGLWADVHAHVVALPFAILAVGLAVSLACDGRAMVAGGDANHRGALLRSVPWAALGVATLTIGALYCINAWDFPTVVAVLCIALIARVRYSGATWRVTLAASGLATLVIVVAAYVLYRPFFAHFQSLYGAVARVREPTALGPFLVIFGVQYAVIAIGVAVQRPAIGWIRAVGSDARVLVVAATLFGSGVALAAQRPVLLLTLPLLGLLALLWLRADNAPGRRMALGIAAIACGLLSAIEVVFLADDLIGGDFERMNTVFKFDFQAWTLLALAMVGMGSIIAERWTITPAALRIGTTALVTLGLIAGLLYPIVGTPARLRQRMPPVPTSAGLDGFAWMATGSVAADQFNNSGSGEPVSFADDLALINWLNVTVRGTPVIAEASIGPYRGNGSRISSATGLPTVIGWERHEEQQRDRTLLPARVQDVRTLYTSAEARPVRSVIDRYHVRYIVVGQVERKTKLGAGSIGATITGEPYASPAGLTTLDRMARDGALRVAWQSHDTVLYEVVGGWRDAEPVNGR